MVKYLCIGGPLDMQERAFEGPDVLHKPNGSAQFSYQYTAPITLKEATEPPKHISHTLVCTYSLVNFGGENLWIASGFPRDMIAKSIIRRLKLVHQMRDTLAGPNKHTAPKLADLSVMQIARLIEYYEQKEGQPAFSI